MMKNNYLTFGTAGIRSKTLTLNDIALVATGYANYLNLKFTDKRPVIYIGFDTRRNSKLFAIYFCRCLAAHNIEVRLFESPVPTPIVTFAIKSQGSGGVMITASHNSSEYHGIKIYNEDGKQILKEDAEKIEYQIDNSFNIAFTNIDNKINYTIVKKYFTRLKKLKFSNTYNNLNITYTALQGTGSQLGREVLDLTGFSYNIVPDECNNKLVSIKVPNPELRSNYKNAIKLAKQYNSDIIFATDCDGDRLGCMVKCRHSYKLLTGNELGILLVNYFKELNKTGTIVTTDVSTLLVNKINPDIIRVPVGFKNIANKVDKKFLLGFEDTGGFLISDLNSDKDAFIALKVISEMASYYKFYNLTLLEKLKSIYKFYGHTFDKTLKIIYPFKKQIYKSFNISNAFKITFRTSGTEPLIKIYINRI